MHRRIGMMDVKIEMEEGCHMIGMVDVSRAIEIAEGHHMIMVDVSHEIGMEVARCRIGMVVVRRSSNRNKEVLLV